MDRGRVLHRAVLLTSGKILVIGGTEYDSMGTGFQNAAIYDPLTGAWTSAADMATGRCAFAVVVLGNGQILVAGGFAKGYPATNAISVLTATSEVYAP